MDVRAERQERSEAAERERRLERDGAAEAAAGSEKGERMESGSGELATGTGAADVERREQDKGKKGKWKGVLFWRKG